MFLTLLNVLFILLQIKQWALIPLPMFIIDIMFVGKNTVLRSNSETLSPKALVYQPRIYMKHQNKHVIYQLVFDLEQLFHYEVKLKNQISYRWIRQKSPKFIYSTFDAAVYDAKSASNFLVFKTTIWQKALK